MSPAPPPGGPSAAAIVVGGAVAKGAFAGGALERLVEDLAQAGVPIRAVVGTSSGALNAAVLAHGVRRGDPAGAARELAGLWEREAGLLHVLDPSLRALRGGGLSGPGRVLRLLEEACPPAPGPEREPVSLRMVLAPLAGADLPTTFERVERFEDADLEDPRRREHLFLAAVASAAFPYAFQPVEVPGAGPCVDGGVVNNTPIGEAVDRFPEVGTVYVVEAEPADLRITPAQAASLGALGLGLRLAEMLVHERLVRDLAEARAVNRWLTTLDRLEAEGRLAPAVRDEVVRSLYGGDPRAFRPLALVEVRPPRALPGSAFSGFLDAGLRRAYVDAGRAAAAGVTHPARA